jgi:hypothetical protein
MAQGVKSADEIKLAQVTAASTPQPAAAKTDDWTKRKTTAPKFSTACVTRLGYMN